MVCLHRLWFHCQFPNSGGDLWWFAVMCGVFFFPVICGGLSFSHTERVSLFIVLHELHLKVECLVLDGLMNERPDTD